MFQQQILVTTAVLTLVVATCDDLTRYRIPNWLVLMAMSIGLMSNAIFEGFSGVGVSLLGALIGAAVLMPFHVMRGISAGDVKLMGAIGSLVGPFTALWSAAYALIAGSLLAVLYVLWRFSSQSSFSVRAMALRVGAQRIGLANLRKERFPYALAIAVGTVLAMWQAGCFEVLGAAAP